jgi:hypothetical protein
MNGREEDRVTFLIALELLGRYLCKLQQPYALINLSIIN